MESKKKLLIYAHYYIPDTASTGQILRELAEGMLDKFDITVICVVPSYLGTIEDQYKTKKYYKEDGWEEIEFPSGKKESDKVICTCFNVTEGQILEAVKINGLKTVEEVTNYTKAGGACGRCKGAIKNILDEYWQKESSTEELTPTQKILKINKVIDQQISPQLQKDGGDIELVDVDGNTVKVKLTGMCSGCKNASMTIKSFVESILKDKVDSNLTVEQV